MVNNKCSVAYCPTAASGGEKKGKGKGGVTHFSFPKDSDLAAHWAAACNRGDNFVPTTSSRICEIHFAPDDFVPPKDPNKRHVVKRLRDGSIPQSGTAEVVDVMEAEATEAVGHIPGVELETVVTDGTVHYDTMEQEITTTSLRPPDVEQTIQIAEANVETIIVKMEAEKAGNEHEHEVKPVPSNSKVGILKKNNIDPDLVPEVVAENTMSVDHGYFLQFLEQNKGNDGMNNAEGKPLPQLRPVNLEPEVLPPLVNEHGEPLTDQEKIERLVSDLKKAYKKNQALAKANKSLRLQLHQANKKTLSQKAKHEVAREIMAPFFTPTQIDCFCRPSWLRSRNWTDQDFELALTLRKLMSKKAFGYLRKKRVVPMPSLTSLRKYQRIHGIVIHHNPNKTGSNVKGSGKKKAAKKAKMSSNSSSGGGGAKIIQAVNVPVSQVMSTGTLDGQQIQIVGAPGTTLGQLQSGSNVQHIQLQVVEAPPKVTRVKTIDENWKFIQITPDGQTATYIHQK